MFFFTTTHYNNLQSLLRLHALAFFHSFTIYFFFYYYIVNLFFSVLFIYFSLSIIYCSLFFFMQSINRKDGIAIVLVIGLVLVVLGVKQNEWHLGFITTQYYAYIYVCTYVCTTGMIGDYCTTFYVQLKYATPIKRTQETTGDLKYRTKQAHH